MKKFTYGYGLSCGIVMMSGKSLQEIVELAMEKGFGYVVRYRETADPHCPIRREVIGWDIEALEFQDAMNRAPRNYEFREILEMQHERNPNLKFIVAKHPKGVEVFAENEFEKIKIYDKKLFIPNQCLKAALDCLKLLNQFAKVKPAV